jgi:hypothetical protein
MCASHAAAAFSAQGESIEIKRRGVAAVTGVVLTLEQLG